MRTDIVVLLAFLGSAFGSMPVYALTGAHRRPDPLESSSRGDFILGSFVRQWFYWYIRPLEWMSHTLRLTPLFYNLLGVALGIGGGIAFALGHLVLGGWGVLLGGAADVLDGRIARARGLASAQGAFLDSTLDRFAEVGAFVGLAVLFRDRPLALLAVVVGLGGSLLVSYARARGESVGIVASVGVMQRAERLLLVGFGGILDPYVMVWTGAEAPGSLLVPALTLVAVGTMGTAVYRTVWIARRLPGAPDPAAD